jgi:hypothetical protein
MSKNSKTNGAAGTNARPLDETIAGTGPGIADDVIGPGEKGPAEQVEIASGAEADAAARKLEEEARQWREGKREQLGEDADGSDADGT